MPKKPSQSLDDILEQFTQRLETTATKPNIYRYVPMEMQELFQQSQAKNRILFGGNRGGKTYGGGADDVQVLLHRHPYRQHLYADGPLRLRWIGIDFDRGIDQIAIPLISQLIPPSFLINGSWEDSYHRSGHMLTLNDKSTMSFMSYEQSADKFQGVSLHHVHMDEEPPKEIFSETVLRLLDTNGTWTISETPVQQLEWIQDDLIEPSESGARPDIQVFYLNTMDNIHLSTQAKLDLAGTLTEDEKIIRLSGKYKGGNMVFPEFERGWPYVIPDESFTLTSDWAIYESMDHGYVNPTAWIWTAVHLDGSIVVFEVLYLARLFVSQWAALVLVTRMRLAALYGISLEQFIAQTRGTFGDPAIADEGNSTAQTGITIQQAYALGKVNIATGGIRRARAGSQNIGLDKIHMYMGRRPATHPLGNLPWMQILAHCTALIDELKKARKPKQLAATAATTNASEAIRDKDNHAIDAIKYLFIVTHDLRPENHRTSDMTDFLKLGAELGATGNASVTHADVFAATLGEKTRTSWSVHGPDSYFAMEE